MTDRSRWAPVANINTGRLTRSSRGLLEAIESRRLAASATVRGAGVVQLEIRGDTDLLLELIERWTAATPPDPHPLEEDAT